MFFDNRANGHGNRKQESKAMFMGNETLTLRTPNLSLNPCGFSRTDDFVFGVVKHFDGTPCKLHR